MVWLLLGWSRSGVGAGVGVDIFRPESESETESLEMRRLRSPAKNVIYFYLQQLEMPKVAFQNSNVIRCTWFLTR